MPKLPAPVVRRAKALGYKQSQVRKLGKNTFVYPNGGADRCQKVGRTVECIDTGKRHKSYGRKRSGKKRTRTTRKRSAKKRTRTGRRH